MHDTSRPREDFDAVADSTAGPTKAVRPDEMSGELCAFLAAIDAYKRAQGVPHLSPADVRNVLLALGYRRDGRALEAGAFEREYAGALLGYKARTKRLFPTWSEIHGLLCGLGWRREAA